MLTINTCRKNSRAPVLAANPEMGAHPSHARAGRFSDLGWVQGSKHLRSLHAGLAGRLRYSRSDFRSAQPRNCQSYRPFAGCSAPGFQALKEEVQPYLWLGPWLDWVPVYGSDIASAPNLFDLADSLLASSDRAYQALTPLLDAYSDTGNLDPTTMIGLLNQAQPQLTDARVDLDLAVAARNRLDPTQLSPASATCSSMMSTASSPFWMMD